MKSEWQPLCVARATPRQAIWSDSAIPDTAIFESDVIWIRDNNDSTFDVRLDSGAHTMRVTEMEIRSNGWAFIIWHLRHKIEQYKTFRLAVGKNAMRQII